MKRELILTEEENFTADTVIEQGYFIYDDWTNKSLPSKKIVSLINEFISEFKGKNTNASSVDALAFLFALDLRIKEKYNSLLRRIIYYFSYRRELVSLNLLKELLKLPSGDIDPRSLIEIKLKKLKECHEYDENEDEDDEVHGGKRNGKAEEEAVTEEKAEEASEEEIQNDEISEKEEELTEENTEEFSDIQKDEEAVKENLEELLEDTEISEAGQEEQQSEYSEEKEESKLEETADTADLNDNFDKKNEKNFDYNNNLASNDAFDVTPIIETGKSETLASEAPTFIDELIEFNIVKGNKDIIGDNPFAENPVNDREASEAKDSSPEKNDDVRRDDKESLRNNSDSKYNGKEALEEQKSQNLSKPEQKEQPKATENVEVIRNDQKDSRTPIEVDITVDEENRLRREISYNMSEEAVQEIYNQQAEVMREQLNIASAELGLDAPTEIAKKNDSPKVEQPTVAPRRK